MMTTAASSKSITSHLGLGDMSEGIFASDDREKKTFPCNPSQVKLPFFTKHFKMVGTEQRA